MDPPTAGNGKGYQQGPMEISGHRKEILCMSFCYEESEKGKKKEVIGEIEECTTNIWQSKSGVSEMSDESVPI